MIDAINFSEAFHGFVLASESADVEESHTLSTHDDLRLWNEACRDPEAFGEIFDRYYGPILRFLTASLGCHDRAEDATGEVFLIAARSYRRLRDGKHLRSWLFGIAANVLKREFGWKVRWMKALGLMKDRARMNSLSDAPGRIAASERDERLRELIGALPVNHKIALLLRADEQLSYREIAEAMSVSEATARSWVSRARNSLKSRIEREGS